jgi:hypothetical protein
MNNTQPSGFVDFIRAKGPFSQIILAVVLATLLYIILISLEIIYTSYKSVANTRVIIEDKTQDNTRLVTYPVNPSSVSNKDYRNLMHSDNENTGIEYSYSCFLLINEGNFTGATNQFKHIFHKGSESLFPLLSPGVFVNAGTNTLRIFQNITTTWYNYIDVENIPVSKWVHLVILVKNNATEVYVNGNLAAKLTSKTGVIYQNYQNLYLFSRHTINLINSSTPSVPSNDPYQIIGHADVLISRLYYYTYALTYTEIQDLMNMGPNPLTVQTNQDKPPYMIDNWWTGQKNLM